MYYTIKNNELNLFVTKSPLFVRTTFYVLALIFMLIPVFVTYTVVNSKEELKFGYLIGLLFSGLIIFYLIRVSLWNTFGFETIKFEDNQISYEANYRWFRDGKKSIENRYISFQINQIGYEEDQKGTLIISNGTAQINCGSKIPIHELHIIINALQQKLKIH